MNENCQKCKCGGTPDVYTRFPVAKQMYQGEVCCPECGEQVFSGRWHHDKDSAVDDAVEEWNKAMEADNEDLKLCPICGGEAFTHIIGNEIAKGYYIACDECGAKTRVFGYEAEAIEAWNRRADDLEIANRNDTDNFENANRNEHLLDIKQMIPERTAKARYSEQDGCYLCGGCGYVIEIEDVYCAGCGAKLDWGE